MSKALEAARQKRAEKVARGEKIERLTPIEKALKNPTSLRLAVNAKCFDCQGQDSDIGVRKRIRYCEVTKCPLHPVRPYQKKGEDEDEGEEPTLSEEDESALASAHADDGDEEDDGAELALPKYKILFDLTLMRPASAALNIEAGCQGNLVARFPKNSVAEIMTPDMQVFELSKDDFEQLVRETKEAHP